MQYLPPSGSLNANAPFVGKDIAAGRQGSKVPRGAVENPQREIHNAIQLAGLSPTNDDLTQLWKAIQKAVADGADDKVPEILDELGITGGRVRVFAAAGPFSWPAPLNAKNVRVIVLGGGGGGGGANGSAGGGGGGGGYEEKTVPVVGGSAYSGFVGAGGVPGRSNGTAATAGGTSSFTADGVTVSATGGFPGTFGNGSATGRGGAPGTGVGGDYAQPGGVAQDGFSFFASNGNLYFGGVGGSSRIASATPFPAGNGSFPGSGPGGGASGAAGTDNGGAGRDGFVVLIA